MHCLTLLVLLEELKCGQEFILEIFICREDHEVGSQFQVYLLESVFAQAFNHEMGITHLVIKEADVLLLSQFASRIAIADSCIG